MTVSSLQRASQVQQRRARSAREEEMRRGDRCVLPPTRVIRVGQCFRDASCRTPHLQRLEGGVESCAPIRSRNLCSHCTAVARLWQIGGRPGWRHTRRRRKLC